MIIKLGGDSVNLVIVMLGNIEFLNVQLRYL